MGGCRALPSTSYNESTSIITYREVKLAEDCTPIFIKTAQCCEFEKLSHS